MQTLLNTILATDTITRNIFPNLQPDDFHPLSIDMVRGKVHLQYHTTTSFESALATLTNRNIKFSVQPNFINFTLSNANITLHFAK